MSSSKPPRDLPQFVERGGEQVIRSPYQQDGTDLRAFVVRGDRRRLAELCTRSFEAPSGGAVRCRPLGDAMVLTFAQIRRLSSLDPRDRQRGWTTENDVIFWVPVLLEYTLDGVATRTLAWMIPYIFVDQPFAVTTGREGYGFPKAQGRFEIPESPASADPYRVHTMVIDRFTPETRAAEGLVLELQRIGDAPGPGLSMREAAALILGDAPAEVLGAGLANLPSLLRGELPVVFLRQLRDTADPTRAAFQEILLAPARTTAIRSRTAIPGAFELRVYEVDSHPMARDLGLRAGTNPVLAALHVDFDFTMENGRTLFASGPGRAAAPAQRPPRQKLAVLGGGLGSLASVFEITEQPDWQDRFDITIYQMGFRLGGKGASGRNAEIGDRIEEHGLHIWFGFYDNAFRMLRRCFAAARRPPGAPIADWREAFEPLDHIVLQEHIEGDWSPWTLLYPRRPGEPGDDGPASTPAEWVKQLATATLHLIESASRLTRAETAKRPRGPIAILEHATFAGMLAALRGLQKLLVAANDDAGLAGRIQDGGLSRVRRRILAHLERSVGRDEVARRLWIAIDLQLTILLGIVRDGLLTRGFDVINHLDFADWLRRHGASELTATAAPICVGYDLVFAYEGGDTTRPRLAAGVALHGLLRINHYRGAVMWKMRAGMGDAVFAPLYEVLRARGVKFEFFHKVRNLALSADGKRVTAITMGRQSTIKGGGEYHPLVVVKGLQCWPDRPHLDQLVEGEALKAGSIDLESSWSPWRDVETVELRAGEHFDSVILGIPPGALRSVASELIARKPEWRTMIDAVQTVCTHAFQLWTRPDLTGLGWHSADSTQGPVHGGYTQPTNTWADMTHLRPFENWPATHSPGHIAYFCGPLSEPDYPGLDDHAFPERQRQRVIGLAHDFLDRKVGHLWPLARGASGGFDYAHLVDIQDTPGRARLRSQLFKGNVEPTDRYTLSLPGTIQHRLRADGSGVDNLFLAGDWIDNGFNAGCVEATVMSGMQCARAITGANIEIAGEPARLRPVARARTQQPVARLSLVRRFFKARAAG